MTPIRRLTGFASLDQPPDWPATPRCPKPRRLEAAVDSLPGVGRILKGRLAKLGVMTVRDLLEHRPRRYEAVAPEVKIAALGGDEEVVIAGEVVTVKSHRRGRLTVLTVRISDGSASVAATFFNQPWLKEQLAPGIRLRIRGRRGRFGFDVKAYDLDGSDKTANLAPVYPAGEELTPKKIRALVSAAMPHAHDYYDPLPAEVRAREQLPLKADALTVVHHPASMGEAELGRERLAFEELLSLQIGIARRAEERERTLAPSLGEAGELIDRYREVLPFALTPYQEQAIREIDADLARTAPMQRLLQGDVGSGKTVVALYALLRAVENGRQGALMAPTETLAEQHRMTIADICWELGVTCGLLTGTSTKRDRELALQSDIVVGTHALIQDGVELRNLAVAVVDEQHRFGVDQRRALKHGRAPHVLHMTATPIPRTLAVTFFGDLAVSEIAKPPPSRKPIITSWVTEERASEAYTRLARLLREGHQAYVVCPLIESSETILALAAEEEADRLQRSELRDFRIGCLHGRVRPAERRERMERFKEGKLDVLVATTVIEVGVDVPNATVMIVQEADRFGLAQLHQLRGRVGRGSDQAYCLLISRAKDDLTETAQRRLEALVATTDGFSLAEIDLDLRGGGAFLGTRQSGLSDLRFARIPFDQPVIDRARAVCAEISADPGPLQDEVDELFAGADIAA